MSNVALKPWTEAEFFAWSEGQELRHELVDGFPRAMGGASNRHNRIAGATFGTLFVRLSGRHCQPMPRDTGVRIPNGQIRYPDVLVECGAYAPQDYAAVEPVLVVEVLSPSTRTFDRTRKLEEYRSVPAIRHILLLDPEAPRAQLYTRDAAGAWQWQVFEAADAVLPLTALDLMLPLAECYQRAL